MKWVVTLSILIANSFLILGCAKKSDSSINVPNLKDQDKTCVPEAELLTAGIVGGARVFESDPDAKNVVLLFAGKQLCTAAAIAPNILLTAAHCVADLDGEVEKSFVVLHTSLSCEDGFDTRRHTLRINKFVSHSGYKRTDEGSVNDIALVFLAQSLPAKYPVYKIAKIKNLEKALPVSSIYFYGYGDVGYNAGGAGILRKTRIRAQDYSIDLKGKLVKINQSNGRGICQGDSGGPGLVKMGNELQILGINSFVAGNTKEALCNGYSYLTLVDSFQSWINYNILLNSF